MITSTFTALLFALYCVFTHSAITVDAVDCSKHKQEWYRMRYTSSAGANVLSKPPTNIDHLGSICPINEGPSCCDSRTEKEMLSVAQRLLIRQIDLNWARTAEQMGNDSIALETFLRVNVEQTRDRSHEFFSRIYGYNYKAHKRFFLQFFADLESYVVGRRNQLDQLIDNFFSQLRDSIVALIERSGQIRSSAKFFSEQQADGANLGSTDETAAETRRIRCLSDRVAQLRPFDDVDVRLKARMMEAYPPARMLVNTLSVGNRLLVRLIKQVSSRPECIVGLTRFQLCPICSGRSVSSVCPESCPKLMSACLSSSGPHLTAVWPRLIDAILLTSMRLERSFNFPAVNRHLQMEISEAITSLQTRYEQTKSKFESECRIGSSGRNVPSLFSSSGSPGRIHQTGSDQHSPTLLDWSRSGYRRNKRSLQQFNRYQASPDLLEWQTRQRNTAASSSQSRLPALAQNYGQFAGQEQRPTWSASHEDTIQSTPESLAHLTARLKRTYSNMKHLFSDHGSIFCPPAASMTQNTTSNLTDCWAPPELTNVNSDQAISETMKLLSDAADRLNQAATESADPDVLFVQTTDVDRAPAVQQPDRFQEPTVSPAAFRSAQSNQWSGQPRQTPFGSFDNPDNRNNMESFGSGTGEPDWGDNYPQPNQPSVDQRQDFSPSEHAAPQPGYSFPDNQPIGNRGMDGSGGGEYPPPPPLPDASSDDYNWPQPHPSTQRGEADSRLAYPDTPTPQPPVQQPVFSHSVSSVPVSSASPSASTTTQATTTHPATTTASVVTSVSLSERTLTESMLTPNTVMPEAMSTEGSIAETSLPAIVGTTKPVTESQTTKDDRVVTSTSAPETTTRRNSFIQEPERRSDPHPVSQLPPYDGFPDDEDAPDFTGYDRPSSSAVHTSNRLPWSETNTPDRQRGSWAEPSAVQRGGSVGADRASANNQFAGPPTHLDPPITEPPPYFSPGSGQPPNPDLFEPQRGFDRPDEYFPQAPQPESPGSQPGWSSPSQPYAVSEGSGSIDGGAVVWQNQGSGHYEPPVPTPPYVEPQTIPVTNPAVESTVDPSPSIKPRPVINHLFLPPPEIWVPAQMGHGHRHPSVLLFREYNVQDPFYQPHAVQRPPSRANFNSSFVFIPLLCALLLFHI